MKAMIVVASIVAGIAAIGITAGCPAAAVPSGNAAACILSTALAGDSILQIAAACGADVAVVLLTLLSSNDPRVTSSAAYAEAVKAKAALGYDAGAK